MNRAMPGAMGAMGFDEDSPEPRPAARLTVAPGAQVAK